MPLVRYRLSDRTRWKPGRCACGRNFPMIEAVTGKLEDEITGGDGNPVSPSVLTFAFKGVENIRKSQVAQVGPGHWELRIVPDKGFSDADRDKLLHNIHHLVDATVRVSVVIRDALPNTAAGKFRWVVNEWRRP
jgi:phenylacetate-CoA ligase